MRAGHEHRRERQPQRLGKACEQPAVVAPENVLIRVGASPALPVTLSLSRRFRQHRGLEWLGDQPLVLEGEDLPHGLIRHRQPAVLVGGRASTSVEVLGRLGHLPTVGG